jgi:anion-transporting  ArsA/GET3 family ATPase
VQKMLRAPTTAFLLVTSAQRESIDEAIWFRRTLERSELPFAGVLVNRVHHDLLGEAEPHHVGAALAARLDPDLASKVAANFLDYHVLARRDHGNIARLAADLGDRSLLLVPQLDDDVHDVEGLLRMHRYLFAPRAQRERLIEQVVA